MVKRRIYCFCHWAYRVVHRASDAWSAPDRHIDLAGVLFEPVGVEPVLVTGGSWPVERRSPLRSGRPQWLRLATTCYTR
jgi:hypothetical protein